MKRKLFFSIVVPMFFIFLLKIQMANGETAVLAYIMNSSPDNTVSVIDTATDQVVGNFDLAFPGSAIAITPDGREVYLGSTTGNVVVLNTSTGRPIGSDIPAELTPTGIAITPDGKRAYVASGSFTSDISVIDTSLKTPLPTPIPVEEAPYGVAVTPNGAEVYVSSWGSGKVSVINTSTNRVSHTITIGDDLNFSEGIAVTPNGQKVYVVNSGPDNISVINTATHRASPNTIPIGENPSAIAITPNGMKAYVTNFSSHDVSVINTSNDNQIATIPVGRNPSGVSVTPNGKKVYVINNGDDNVSVIDTSSDEVIDTIKVGHRPESFGNFIATINLGSDATSTGTNRNSGGGCSLTPPNPKSFKISYLLFLMSSAFLLLHRRGLKSRGSHVRVVPGAFIF